MVVTALGLEKPSITLSLSLSLSLSLCVRVFVCVCVAAHREAVIRGFLSLQHCDSPLYSKATSRQALRCLCVEWWRLGDTEGRAEPIGAFNCHVDYKR